MSDNHNMEIPDIPNSTPLVKTTVVLLFMNWINSMLSVSSISLLDTYVLFIGHCLLAVTAAVSLLLNWNNIKNKINEIRGKSKPNS